MLQSPKHEHKPTLKSLGLICVAIFARFTSEQQLSWSLEVVGTICKINELVRW